MTTSSIPLNQVCDSIVGIISQIFNDTTVTSGISSKKKAAQQYIYVGCPDSNLDGVVDGSAFGGEAEIHIVINLLYDNAPDRLRDLYNKTDPAVENSLVDLLWQNEKTDAMPFGIKFLDRKVSDYIVETEPDTTKRAVRTNPNQKSFQNKYMNCRIRLIAYL